MKKQDIPQDEGPLKDVTREVVYAKNDEGKYEKSLSKGWTVKADALDNAWSDINEKCEEAKKLVSDGKRSPIYYFMQRTLMDVTVLSGYVQMNRFAVKRHLKPSGFSKLSQEKLSRYAEAFDVHIEDLTEFEARHGV